MSILTMKTSVTNLEGVRVGEDVWFFGSGAYGYEAGCQRFGKKYMLDSDKWICQKTSIFPMSKVERTGFIGTIEAKRQKAIDVAV